MKKKGKVISIINNKGGCSKTTTACTLAHALGRKSKKILVIDNDTQCNTLNILLHKKNIENSLYHLLSQDVPVETCIYATNYKSVFCLPNNQRTAAFEIPLLRKELKNSLLLYNNKLKEYVCNNFELILIDNPPNLGLFTAMSLYMSDFAIVPNDAGSKFSLEGLINAVSFIEEIKNSGNSDLKFLRLLITKVDRRTNASNAIVEHIKNSFPDKQRFKTTIPINAAFQQAELFNQTIIKFRSNAPGAIAYKQVADELINIIKNIVD